MGIHIVVVDVGSDIREQLIADLVRRAVENDDVRRHVVLCEEFADGVHRHPERLILGIAENTGGDQRKGNRLTAVLLRQHKAGAIAGGELFPLAALTAVPNRAHGVDDVAARQAVRAGDLGLASPAVAQSPALCQQLRPRRPMDTAIHAATAQQRFLRRVDDGVHTHFRDVIANNFKRHGSIPQFLSFKIKPTRRCLPPFPLRTVLPNLQGFRAYEDNQGHRPQRTNRSCKT